MEFGVNTVHFFLINYSVKNLTWLHFQAKKNQIARLSAKWPLILPKDPNTSNQPARSFAGQDQNLMPPPSTLENKSNTSNSKRTKCKGNGVVFLLK